MKLTESDKQWIRRELAEKLCREAEVRKVIIFGSFLSSAEPRDLDVAVFQDSDESYIPLALKYRKETRETAGRIPIDILPLRASARDGCFLNEIHGGEVVYER